MIAGLRPFFLGVLVACALTVCALVSLGAFHDGIQLVQASSRWRHTKLVTATQGEVWVPKIITTYTGSRRTFRARKAPTARNTPCSRCNWMVMTTIFGPTAVFRQFQSLADWCVVVVGDLKTDSPQWQNTVSNESCTFYLSPNDQKSLNYELLKYLKWNHFGRKTVGYLYAIQQGATTLWDTDDDNELIHLSALTPLLNNTQQSVPCWASPDFLVNPYPWFRAVSQSGHPQYLTWPRGYPLELVKSAHIFEPSATQTVPFDKVAIFQSLADNNPDIDAVHRLTKPIPNRFELKQQIVALNSSQLAPFNAQATLWLQNALWGLLLPISVHGRVSDIWRSYITQTALRYTQFSVAFTSSNVVQNRNVHSLIGDFESEIPLYLKSNALTSWLHHYQPPNITNVDLPTILEDIVIRLYEIGVVEKSDIHLVQAWINDLIQLGYTFPSVQNTSQTSNVQWDESVRDRVVSADVRPAPKTAVCVSGQVRTLDLSLLDDDHPHGWPQMKGNMRPPDKTVAESIQQTLFPQLSDPDVFMHVSTREGQYEPLVGNLSTCEPLRPKNGNLQCIVEAEKEIPIVNGSVWDSFRYPDAQMEQGLLQQLYGMYKCYMMIEQYEEKKRFKYDYIVRLRPDTYFEKVADLSTLFKNAASAQVFYAGKKHCCCGNEDTFGIGPAEYMRTYLRRYVTLHVEDWGCWDGWFAEPFLAKVLNNQNISLVESDEIAACVLKPKHRGGGKSVA